MIVTHMEKGVPRHDRQSNIVHIGHYEILGDQQFQLRFDPIGYGSHVDGPVSYLRDGLDRHFGHFSEGVPAKDLFDIKR